MSVFGGRRDGFNEPSGRNCACDACPCSIVNQLSDLISPVTNFCPAPLSFILNCCVDVICGVCSYTIQALQCRGNCQHPQETKPGATSEVKDITLVAVNSKGSFMAIKNVISKTSMSGRIKDPSKASGVIDATDADETQDADADNVSITKDDISKKIILSDEESQKLPNCPKCDRQHKACDVECPKAKN